MRQIFSYQISRFILLGFISTAGQIVLLREYLTLHQGNELSLGIFLSVWLFWTGLGSFLAGRLGTTQSLEGNFKNWLQFFFALLIPLTLLLLRLLPIYWQSVPGEESGLSSLLLSSFLLIAPFCITSGALFSVLAKTDHRMTQKNEAISVSQVYVFETVGSASAGMTLSLLFILNVPPVSIALLLFIIGVIPIFSHISWSEHFKSEYIVLTGFFLVTVIILYSSDSIEKITLQIRWKNFNITEVKYSRYGQLAVIRNEENYTVYENGLPVSTFPDRLSAEEAVHYALLMHENPEFILMIGGGISGSAAEALKHPSIRQIDYVELDPEIIQIIRAQVLDFKNYLPDDNRLKIYHEDGRMFLKKQVVRYDVILVQLPDPHTAQLNRFFTREFFKLCRERLSDHGLLSFQAQSAENYISDELGSYLTCLSTTVKDVFPYLAIMPGVKAQFFASPDSSVVQLDADKLITRLESRGIVTQFVNRHFIPFRLMPERLNYFRERLSAAPYSGINTDFMPRAYFLANTLWGKLYSEKLAHTLSNLNRIPFSLASGFPLLLLFLSMLFLRRRQKQSNAMSYSGKLSIFITGLSALALEILILFTYQALYGYIYLGLAFIIAGFMSGMSLGGWLGKNFFISPYPHKSLRILNALHGGQLICLLSIMVTSWLHVPDILLHPIIAVVTIGSGIITGSVFPLANHIYFSSAQAFPKNTGLIYGIDLFGALTGAMMISVFYLPVYGFIRTSFLLMLFQAGIILILTYILRFHKPIRQIL